MLAGNDISSKFFYDNYRVVRNLVVTHIKIAKQRYYEQFLDPATQSGKVLWQKLRKLGVGKQKSCTSAEVDCNVLNSQFVSIASQSQQDNDCSHFNF